MLIVDDEPGVRDLMARWVASLGLLPRTAADAESALESLNERHADLAVIDIMMPGKNGLWLAGEIRRDHPNTAVVLATGYTECAETAAADGPVVDLLVKPFQRDRFVLALDRGRQWRRAAMEELEWHARLSRDMGERLDELRHLLARQRALGLDDGQTLMLLGEDRMPAVMRHSERVRDHCVSIASELQLDDVVREALEQAALFHDIGKAAVPEPLLTKPSGLSPAEIAIMRRHAEAGAEILEATETAEGRSSLKAIAATVRASHEWFGGGGYPQKLSGAAIPLASRIIAVADAYDAMTEDRSYRKSLDSDDAVAELLRAAPSQFDPDIVVAFLTVLGRPGDRSDPQDIGSGRPTGLRPRNLSSSASIH